MSRRRKTTPRHKTSRQSKALNHLLLSLLFWVLEMGLLSTAYESMAAGYFAAILGSWAIEHAGGWKVNPLDTGGLVVLMTLGYAADSEIYWKYVFFGLNSTGLAARLWAQRAPTPPLKSPAGALALP